MKFTTWYPAAQGEKRTTTWFAILPVTLGNDCRWLEKVTVQWEYIFVDTFLPPCSPVLKWRKIRFIDSKE